MAIRPRPDRVGGRTGSSSTAAWRRTSLSTPPQDGRQSSSPSTSRRLSRSETTSDSWRYSASTTVPAAPDHRERYRHPPGTGPSSPRPRGRRLRRTRPVRREAIDRGEAAGEAAVQRCATSWSPGGVRGAGRWPQLPLHPPVESSPSSGSTRRPRRPRHRVEPRRGRAGPSRPRRPRSLENVDAFVTMRRVDFLVDGRRIAGGLDDPRRGPRRCSDEGWAWSSGRSSAATVPSAREWDSTGRAETAFAAPGKLEVQVGRRTDLSNRVLRACRCGSSISSSPSIGWIVIAGTSSSAIPSSPPLHFDSGQRPLGRGTPRWPGACVSASARD